MPETGEGAFHSIDSAAPTVVDRLADVLSESFREDTSTEFRLGLLQGALQIAMPQLAPLDGSEARSRAGQRTE